MNVGEMQRKLSGWAEQDKARKFADLFNLLYDLDWLKTAHDHVKQNAGSRTAGCDGVTMTNFDEQLEENLQKLAEELKSGTFEPQPVRRVYITKSDGETQRPLGIPAIKDRIVQEALRMVLEPIFEAGFSPYSFGFRPGRCTMDAIKCITWSCQERKKFFWVIEGDIASYFDSVHHRKLVKLLKRKIKDKKIIKLIWSFLRAGVMERKLFKDSKCGLPQGGIASPLFANVFLHALDQYMHDHYTGLSKQEKTRRRRQGLANVVYCRYADDFVALCNGTKQQAEALKQELNAFLRDDLRLELSWEKTKVTHLNDGFRFLGFWIQRKLGSKGMTTKVEIPREALQRVKEKIASITCPTTHQDSVNAKILALNLVISGWCRYYQYSSKASTTFSKLRYFVFWRMAHWLGRKFRISMPRVMHRFRQGNSFATKEQRLLEPTAFKTRIYKQRFLKANPYTTAPPLHRETSLQDSPYWTGHERRPGMTDLRFLVLSRDQYRCQSCGHKLSWHTAQVDHKKPVRRFKQPDAAHTLANLHTLCVPCHRLKTKECFGTQAEVDLASRLSISRVMPR